MAEVAGPRYSPVSAYLVCVVTTATALVMTMMTV
jgi:hypothetical protein